MNLKFSYRICAVIETEEIDRLNYNDHSDIFDAVEACYSALIWKNAGQYALVTHFQATETLRVHRELFKPDNEAMIIGASIFWDDCIPIPNELAEELLWRREPENKSDKPDHGSDRDSK